MPYPWSAGNVLTATDLNSALASKTDLAMVQNAQTGTSYSFVLLDASKLLTMSNASANTVLVTKQATVTWVTGTQLRVMNLGAGATTLVADTGVTINGNVSLKQYQGGTLIRTASDVWLFVPTASVAGMDLITPTSVAGSGVTLSGGEVTLTAATSVNVNGCFSSNYDNYRIVATRLVGSTDLSANLRLRASATDASGANYNSCYVIGGPATASSTRFTGETSARFAMDMNATTSEVVCDIASPFLALPTGFAYNINRAQGNSIYCMSSGHTLSTSYDGFSLVLTTGNLTGKIRIYGLRNS